MKTLKVAALDGITPEVESAVYEAMKTCTNGQRLATCLLFLSGLPDGRHRLAEIETALRRIFPPALRSSFEPSHYKSFQASAVRFLFNKEALLVRGEQLAEADRLWMSPMRAHWRNTELGNRLARELLRQRGILLEIGGHITNATPDPIPPASRPYLEEDAAEEALAASSEELMAQQPEDEAPTNLLALVDSLLDSVPAFDGNSLPREAAASFSTEGSVKAVQQLLRALMDRISPSEAVLTVKLSRDGCLVSVATK